MQLRSGNIVEEMSNKKSEREIRAALRRQKKDRKNGLVEYDDFSSLNNQLNTLGLNLKQITGDGNCLFRALGDQLDGNSQNHESHRASVVNYMRANRNDFEPFMEDNATFEDHLRNLSELGTFGGNDSIVAFARLHRVTVVIHQVNKPLWQIHGSSSGTPCDREIHISYHNGDHYNSVRRAGDRNTETPARIKLASQEQHVSSHGGRDGARNDNQNWDTARYSSDLPDSGTESDYENSPSANKINILADRVERSTGISDRTEIFEALEFNAYCVTAAVDYLLRNNARESGSMASSNLWSEGGTGNRIFGDSVSREAVTSKKEVKSRSKSGQEKLEGIQAKLNNKNLSNKRRKELKKAGRKVANEERRRAENEDGDTEEVVIANVKTLTI